MSALQFMSKSQLMSGVLILYTSPSTASLTSLVELPDIVGLATPAGRRLSQRQMVWDVSTTYLGQAYSPILVRSSCLSYQVVI